MDTIFAVATGRGKAGVSVVRVSGPGAFQAAERFVGSLPPARRAGVRDFRDSGGRVIDRALVLRFDAGKSFTGEAVVEFHLHGSPAVVAAVLQSLSTVEGCRLADAGEFTRRALENDVLDLAQVEGLGDLIEAETEAQRLQAMRVFSGELGGKVAVWRGDLLRAAALLEATIDFVDEEVPVDVSAEVRGLLENVLAGLKSEVSGYAAAERIRDGFEVALVGETNVGKSTLLNRLAGRDAAITSEIAGTTRDVIEVRMDIGGLPVTVLDTAGVRASDDEVERIGVARTRQRAEAADLRVFLLPGAGAAPALQAEEGDIVLVGKADIGKGGDVSGLTGEGVDDLLRRVGNVLSKRAAGAGLAIKERHRAAMEAAMADLSLAVVMLSEDREATEVIAEHVRSSARALDALVGRMDVEHILGEIFSRFCVGK